MTTNTPTPFTERDLAILVEEYITQQRSEFTLKGLYDYVVYWGMEDNRIAGDQLTETDKEKVYNILKRVVKDGWIKEQDGAFIKQ